MNSLWTDTVSIPERESLHGDIKTEAVVIGGGLAGILTARLLEESGVKAVVLEGARKGSMQTPMKRPSVNTDVS